MSHGFDARKQRRMALTAAIAAGAVFAMAGLSVAAVPLYKAFCQATGYGGTPKIGGGPATGRLDRPIDVRFDANTAADLPVRFGPEVRSQRLVLGETSVAFFDVHNFTDAPVTGVASFNVTPHKAAKYFNKLQCFCFKESVFGPGETSRLAVMFYVDPALASDPETQEVGAVTLSYTFFRSADEAAAALGGAS